MRRRLTAGTVSLACALGMMCTGPASAAEKAVVEAFLTPDGSGELLASENFREGKGWSWEACTASLANCVQYATGEATTTARAMPETVFRATSRAGVSALSPVWHGKVRSLGPPSVRGQILANELVTPIAGQWSGGWDGDYDWTQLAACATPAGTDCTTLTDQHFNGSCPTGAAVLDPAFVGQYLRVADQRVDAEAGIELYAISSPYHHGEIWQAGPLNSVAIVGKIGRAEGPRKAECGPPPIVAAASISKRGIIKFQCTLGCHITAIGRRGARVVRIHSKGLQFSNELQFSPDKRAYIAGGPVQVSVLIDGKRVAHRVVRNIAP
jgi:hypothetical protein